MTHDPKSLLRPLPLGRLADRRRFRLRPFQVGTTTESCALHADGSEVVWIGVNGFKTGAIDFNLVVESVPPLFADGFESGNTSAWSLTVP